MLPFYDYSQFFIAMLAIVDPITILPLYIKLVRNFEESQQRILARRAALSVTIALVLTVFIGQKVLAFFGISLGSFQVAGGLLLLIVALQLMYSNDVPGNQPNREILPSEVVVPLAIPMLAGPGAFSTVIVYSYRSESWAHWGVMCACLLVLGALVWLVLHLANPLMKRLSVTFISITNKIMGLIMAAISIEFIAHGIKTLFSLA